MTRTIGNTYWFFILFLQTFIIHEKLALDGFYFWNVVAMISAIVFLFYRIKTKIVKVNPELTLAGFIALNGVMTAVSQLIRFSSFLILAGSLVVAITSLLVVYYIWKYEDNKAGTK